MKDMDTGGAPFGLLPLSESLLEAPAGRLRPAADTPDAGPDMGPCGRRTWSGGHGEDVVYPSRW